MRTTILLTLALAAIPLFADDWSLGVATGPFVFGRFVERSVRVGNGTGSSDVSKTTFSARTRPGLTVGLEHGFSERFAIRAEGAFTETPITIKGSTGSSGVALDAGKIDFSTVTMPLVFRINPHGALRFNVHAGPAYALYHMRRRGTQSQIFDGTRGRWAGAAGAGLAWWWSQKFAVEADASDIASASPFKRTDFGGSSFIKILRVNNVQTTVGLRWKL